MFSFIIKKDFRVNKENMSIYCFLVKLYSINVIYMERLILSNVGVDKKDCNDLICVVVPNEKLLGR